MSVLINWILLSLCIYSTSKQEAEEEEEEAEEEDWTLDLFTSNHRDCHIEKPLIQAHLPIMTKNLLQKQDFWSWRFSASWYPFMYDRYVRCVCSEGNDSVFMQKRCPEV